MSLTGGHLDALLAAGATAEQIVALVKADMIEREKALETKRAKDAERQRRHRESRDVTVTECDPCDKGSLEVPPPAPPLPNPSKSSPLNPPVVLEEKRAAIGSCLKRAYRPPIDLPDWMPPSYGEFRAMRKGMRNVPFTDASERRAIAKLTRLRAEGHDPEKLLSKAIECGHRTFFEDETTRAAAGKIQRTAVEWREQAEWYARRGNRESAEECRKKAIEIEQAA